MDIMQHKHVVVDNVTYEVVATVHDDETNQDFVVFTDKDTEVGKDIKLSCALYYEEKGKIIPVKITDEENEKIAKEVMEEVMRQLQSLIKR